MKPPFCRTGTKYQLSKYIIPYIPEHDTYVELFAGGAGMYFRKQPSSHEVLNDLDKNLISAYRLIKKVSTNIDMYPSDMNTIEAQTAFLRKKHNTNEDKLVEYIIRSCSGFSGRYITNTKVWRAPDISNKIKRIAEYKQRMKNTRILNSDYRAVIAHYDSPKTFFYLDPPYPKSGHSKLYKHSEIDYEEMRDILSKIRGKFILSIDDTPLIRKLYNGFKIKKIKILKTSSEGIGQKTRTELIIYN